MRPHRPTAKRKSTGIARARLLMKANLQWLCGYPHNNVWQVVHLEGGHTADTVVLDRALVRKATYTANTLRRDFPRALRQLVGAPEVWRNHLDTILALLKTRIHQDAALPSNLFEAAELYPRAVRIGAADLVAASPALVPWVRAISWTLATTPRLAPRYLRAAEAHADAMARALTERPGPATVAALVQLVHLVVHLGSRLVAPLVALAGHPAAYRLPLRGAGFGSAAQGVLEAKSSELALPTRDPGTFDGQIRGWLGWLVTVDAPTQRRFLRVLGLCNLEPLLGDWFTWWRATDGYMALARRLAEARMSATETRDRYTALAGRFQKHRRGMPVEVDEACVGRVLREVAETGFAIPPATVRKALEHMPNEQSAMRLGLLLHWARLLRGVSPQERNSIAALATRFASYLARTGHEPRALAPWRTPLLRAVSDQGGWGVDSNLTEEPVAVIKRVLDAIEHVALHDPALLTDVLAERIVEIAEVVRNPARIAAIAERYHRAKPAIEYVEADVLRAALASCGDDLTELPGLIRTFTYVDDETNLGAAGLRTALVPLFRHHRGLVNEILVGKDSALVLQCARRLAAVVATGHAPPRPRRPKASTEWIGHYPASLRRCLEELASTTEDAEDIARKLLRSAWRPAPELRAERMALRERLATVTGGARDKLERRLAGLDDRIAHPRPLSDAKTAKLIAKVRRRAGLALLDGLSARATAVIAQSAAELLATDVAPDWITSDRALPLLTAILELKPPSRKLGLRILRERCGPPPWDLRDAPKNRAFLARMRERGIDCAPWLDGIEPVVANSPRGPITLAFERDPLEALHMGGHFQTCLAPGAFNFFSAVSNCADINKRVLYGRSEDGTVVARRLMCLTGEGKLLAFNAYCHYSPDSEFDFDAASAAIATDLARAMKTTTAAAGNVPCTLSTDWYDDGSRDITGAHALLADGSPFRVALATVAPIDLPALIERETGAPTLEPFLAPSVIGLDEIAQRPVLAIPLCSLVGPLEALELPALYSLAYLITQAGAANLARERLAAPLFAGIARAQRTRNSYTFQHVDLLCRLDAARGLRILRLTRPHGTRTWADEEATWRLTAVAGCLERLSRPVQAMRIYALAAKANGTDDDRAYARARAAALARKR